MSYTYYRRYRQPRRRPKKASSFKSFFWLVVLLVCIALVVKACVSVINRHSEEQRNEAILSIERGSAEILIWGEADFRPASDSQILLVGDQVRTSSNSIATLKLHNGSEIRLDENTLLSFTEVDLVENNDYIHLDLEQGRVWVNHLAKEVGDQEILLRTGVMNIVSMGASYLASNDDVLESLFVFDEQVNVEYVDRGTEDIVIEVATVRKGNQSLIDARLKNALLERENVTLVEVSEDDFLGDEFVEWNLGTSSLMVLEEELAEEPLVPEEEELEDDELDELGVEEKLGETPVEFELEEADEAEIDDSLTEDSTEPLIISISSPAAVSTIQEDAIAIEGRIVSGQAERVTVTWSGDGVAYDLSLFEAGGDSFRYVADVQYLNFANGENTYTIRAYDSDGVMSNEVTIIINGGF